MQYFYSTKWLFILGLLTFSTLSSCSYWIHPPLTSVEQIIKVNPGINLDQVNATLGIEPYDIYHIQEENTVVLYKYRKQDLKTASSSGGKNAFERMMSDEASQTRGNKWWRNEVNTLFVIMKDGQVRTLITDAGRSRSEVLLLISNDIKYASENGISNISPASDKAHPGN